MGMHADKHRASVIWDLFADNIRASSNSRCTTGRIHDLHPNALAETTKSACIPGVVHTCIPCTLTLEHGSASVFADGVEVATTLALTNRLSARINHAKNGAQVQLADLERRLHA